jgi:hypothetical protein
MVAKVSQPSHHIAHMLAISVYILMITFLEIRLADPSRVILLSGQQAKDVARTRPRRLRVSFLSSIQRMRPGDWQFIFICDKNGNIK